MVIALQDGGFKVVRGRILNPLSDAQCEFLADGLIIASPSGGAWRIEEIGDATLIAAERGWSLSEISPSQGIILPPFYDIHFHWVQDDVRDMPKASLLEWLESYAFPTEGRFADPDYAEAKAKYFWRRILATGTVGGLCFSSVHQTALDTAMKYAGSGFRIGGSLMTMNCPDYLAQTVEAAVAAARYGAETYGDRYAITPRFAPATAPEVMSQTAQLAGERDLFIQTHLDETTAEIEWVLGMYREMPGFENVKSYTEIYDRCGVLGPKTVMAHAIFLEESEWELLAKTGTSIASCPTSNAPLEQRGLGSGLFDFEQAERHGIPWALASDIGGGPYLSLFDVMASFIAQNHAAGNHSATYAQALYRSTQAPAEILGFGRTRGNFQPGKRLDFIECPCPDLQADSVDAEKVIESLIKQVTERRDFDDLPLATVLDGETVFERAAV